MKATIHLVRHGEVENPKGVIYGRLPGYHLSERGLRQAAAAAERLRTREIGALWASPLERAQETAQAIAHHHDIDIVTDERLIESSTTLEGIGRSARQLLMSPRNWWHFRNPMKPSWGESFGEIRKRMLDAIAAALDTAAGKEVVVVSHQTPVLVARFGLARRNIPPWLGLTPCGTGSVTTMEMDGDRVVAATYYAPPI